MIAAYNITNFSLGNGREGTDFYPTPPEATIALLQKLQIPKDSWIWEPACGNGMMAETMRMAGWRFVYATNLHDQGYGIPHIDFLQVERKPTGMEWIVTNPPFKLAEDFIEHAHGMLQNMRGFALLLKCQFWHAKKRVALFRKCKPTYVWNLSWRPDFLFGGRGGRPTIEVQWNVWISGGNIDTTFDVLEKPGPDNN